MQWHKHTYSHTNNYLHTMTSNSCVSFSTRMKAQIFIGFSMFKKSLVLPFRIQGRHWHYGEFPLHPSTFVIFLYMIGLFVLFHIMVLIPGIETLTCGAAYMSDGRMETLYDPPSRGGWLIWRGLISSMFYLLPFMNHYMLFIMGSLSLGILSEHFNLYTNRMEHWSEP